MKRLGKVLLGILLTVVILLTGALAYFQWVAPYDSKVDGDGVGIARVVTASETHLQVMDELPSWQKGDTNPFASDLRLADLRGLQLTDQGDQLFASDFTSQTLWPDELPDGFDPGAVLENGKNPGLSVRSVLYERGITGKGVSIGIIDMVLLTDHMEYGDRLKHYEEIHEMGQRASMHGPAVASIALGRNTGVAPEANLYFIAASLVENMPFGMMNIFTYRYLAQAIDRFLELNDILPQSEKIRVISISRGFDPRDAGYKDIIKAIARAEAQGVLVISTSSPIAGLNRDPLGDPDDRENYTNGSWQTNFDQPFLDSRYAFPMDARTYAARTGPEDYEYSASGGWSWTVPYAAGLYALCVQVYPDMTPDLFWQALEETSSRVAPDHRGVRPRAVDPVALVEYCEGLL